MHKETGDMAISKKSGHRHGRNKAQKNIFYIYFYLLPIRQKHIFLFISNIFYLYIFLFVFYMNTLEMVARAAGDSIDMAYRGICIKAHRY